MAGKHLGFLLVLTGLVFRPCGAQSMSYAHTLIVGSEGVGQVRAPGAEDDLEDLHRFVVRLLSLRPKIQLTVRPSPGGEESRFFKRIATLSEVSDSSEAVIGVCRGAWNIHPRFVEKSTLSGITPDSLTADYLLHLMMFLPVHNAVLFVLSPDQFDFPKGTLAGVPTGINGGGRYIITVRSREQADFGALSDRFADMMDSDWDDARSDKDGDKNLSFSEWLSSFARRAAAAGLTGSIYQISSGPDLLIKQLK